MSAVIDKAEVGRRLRDIRRYRSQREIALELGVSMTAIGKYERGECMPSDDVKVRYADLSGKTVQEIFFDVNAT